MHPKLYGFWRWLVTLLVRTTLNLKAVPSEESCLT